jgi:hypothetical protein
MAVEHVAPLDELAQTQHSLITTAQALKVLGPSRKQRWVADGRLLSVQPGVFRIAGSRQTWHQALMAAALAADAIVSHRSAAELWGLIQPAGYVDVSVAPPRQPRLRPPAILHRIADLRPDLAVEREGLRLTDPIRTIVDLGLVLPTWSVRDALSRGITTKLVDVERVQWLREALGRRGRNGTGVIQAVLDERSLMEAPEESLLERRFMSLVTRAGLPRPVFQHEVWHNGRFVARVDGAYADRKVAIEIDGFSAHSSPDAFQRDRTRQNRLVALGWTVLRFTWDDVVKRPTMVATTILEALNRPSAA